MKRIIITLSVFVSFILIFITFSLLGLNDSFKPGAYITIKGVEGDYVACLVAKDIESYVDYEDWKEWGNEFIDYNPIIEYTDEEGYKWIEEYYYCTDETEIVFSYYCPKEYKIVIYKNNQFYGISKSIHNYAYVSYFDVDFMDDTINKTYDYELYSMLMSVLFLVSGVLIQLGMFLLFKLFNKDNFKLIILFTIIIQLFFSLFIGVNLYTNGWLFTIVFLLLFFQAVVCGVEMLIYLTPLINKKKHTIITCVILSNVFRLIVGGLILGYIQ